MTPLPKCHGLLNPTAEDNSQGKRDKQNKDLQRQEGSRECIGNPSKQIKGPTGHNGIKAKGCRRHCFDICCVAHQAEVTPKWSSQAPIPPVDIAAIAKEPIVYVPDENCRKSLREESICKTY